MEKLFTPSKIGSLEIKNRIVMPSMHLNYTPDGEINELITEFYKERARGGTGLIIVGGCSIDDYGRGPMMVDVSDKRFIKGLTGFTEAIHNEGAKVAAQLYHAGRYAHSILIGRQAIAPSPIASSLTREEPREMTIEDIKNTISSFVKAALTVKESGFDAVEVLASAGYIIPQFLSPITNQRDDEYGGNFENRMRFGLELIGQVKDAVGSDFPVIVRVAGNDFMPGGNTNKESREFCRNLVEKTGIDCINVTGGWHETRVPQLTMRVPHGAYVYLAEKIKKDVSVPVIACNRINNAEHAEKIIASGKADFVGIARGLITDPEFPEKAQKGQSKRIRPCIGCNQGCLDMVFSLQKVVCLANPQAGREMDTKITPAEKSKKVLIIGGGVAGMEAARVASLRGHSVTLWEKDDKLGGQLHLAAAPPGRYDFIYFAEYLANEMKELGVIVKTGIEANTKNIKDEDFDVLIVATGATPLKPPIPGIDKPNVIQAWDVLAGNYYTGDNVVIIGGGAVGTETALKLAEEGTISDETLRFLFVRNAESDEVLHDLALKGDKNITVVEMMKKIGKDIGLSTRWTIIDDLKRCGVNMLKNSKVKEITDEGVVAESEDGDFFIPADTVIVAAGSQSENRLFNELKDIIGDDAIYLLGDAKKPQKALEAVHNAFELAMRI